MNIWQVRFPTVYCPFTRACSKRSKYHIIGFKKQYMKIFDMVKNWGWSDSCSITAGLVVIYQAGSIRHWKSFYFKNTPRKYLTLNCIDCCVIMHCNESQLIPDHSVVSYWSQKHSFDQTISNRLRNCNLSLVKLARWRKVNYFHLSDLSNHWLIW